MIKTNKHIEIVRSNKTWLSSMSQKSAEAILRVLSKHYAHVGITTVDNMSDLEELVACRPDLVFLGMKFVPVDELLGWHDSEKVWLADYLDEHGITYTGSRRVAHELELNKAQAKQTVLDAGLETSPFWLAKQDERPGADLTSLAFPLFVKPANRGGGLGVSGDSVVYNTRELQSKIGSIATELRSDSLVEEYLPGREFSVAILKNEYLPGFSIMPIELAVDPDERGLSLLSGHVKSSDTEHVQEVPDGILKDKITTLAMDVFYALGARDYGRFDIRLDRHGVPQFLEANLLPSLISGYGSFPRACVLNMNLAYEPMLLSIVQLALARSLDETGYILEPELTASALLPSLESI